MVCAPTPAGVQLTAQLVLTAPVTGSVLAPPGRQWLAVKRPPAGGTLLALQLTVPLGALAEVGVLSVTVAVQLVGLPTGSSEGRRVGKEGRSRLLPDPSKKNALLRCVVAPL